LIGCALMRRFQGILDHEYPITGCRNVTIFVHVKIDEIVIFGKMLNRVILTTSDWIFMIYDSLE